MLVPCGKKLRALYKSEADSQRAKDFSVGVCFLYDAHKKHAAAILSSLLQYNCFPKNGF